MVHNSIQLDLKIFYFKLDFFFFFISEAFGTHPLVYDYQVYSLQEQRCSKQN